MRVRVLLFGPEAAAVGRESVEVELAGERATSRDVLERIAADHPALAPHMNAARLAVNHRFAAPDDPVRERDELAVIGMVSGG